MDGEGNGNGNGNDGERFLPLARLEAALCWIESCHKRRYEDTKATEAEGRSGDPLLPPPQRRTMWPSTLAALKQRHARTGVAEKTFHPDAPLLLHRAASPTGVQSVGEPLELAPDDASDDARLLRACLALLRCGKLDDAAKMAEECGQPWRAASWTGGKALGCDEAGGGEGG